MVRGRCGRGRRGSRSRRKRSGTLVTKLFFLQASKASRLRYGERLMSLYLTANLRGEPGDKAAKEERCRQAHDAVSKVFKFREVSRNRTLLHEFEQRPHGVLVLRRCEPCLKRLQKDRPQSELTVTGHPLKPGQGAALHVKGGNRESIMLRCAVILEVLVDLKDPT